MADTAEFRTFVPDFQRTYKTQRKLARGSICRNQQEHSNARGQKQQNRTPSREKGSRRVCTTKKSGEGVYKPKGQRRRKLFQAG